MKKIKILLILISCIALLSIYQKNVYKKSSEVLSTDVKLSHWLLLYRKSNVEFLYFGIPGEKQNSKLIKKFKVKTGIPGERPTPLPELLKREYWLIIDKMESKDNPETSPYFLTLDIPISSDEPFGPTPYLECNDPLTSEAKQCNWVLPGNFGLHGSGGNPEKLSEDNPGSSGCIRHFDEDITFLYNLLNPEKEEIRYYIENI